MKKSLRSLTSRPIHHIKPKSCAPSRRIICNGFSGQTAGGASSLELWHNGEMTFCISCGENADVQLSLRLPVAWTPLTFSGPQPFFFMSARPYLPDPPSLVCWLTIQLKACNSSAERAHTSPPPPTWWSPWNGEGLHQLPAGSFVTVTGPVMVIYYSVIHYCDTFWWLDFCGKIFVSFYIIITL